MQKTAILALAFALSNPLLACVNPGDEHYAEVLAHRHLHDFLDLIDNTRMDESEVEAKIEAFAAKQNEKLGDWLTDSSDLLPSLEGPSIQDIDTNNFDVNTDTDYHQLSLDLKDNPNYWQERLRKVREPAQSRSPAFEILNEYAAALIFTGDYEEAIQSLKKQEKLYPGKYETATNIGTAYELSGKLKQAKKWIATGRQRNPSSHQGSEWLHSAILDAKIALEKNPDWLQNHYVSTAEFDWSNAQIRMKTRDAIMIQLSERLVFVKAPDPIVSSLFFELGTIYEYENSIQHAERFYQKSLEFGDIRRQAIEEQRAQRNASIHDH
ncbi:hypothetical protein [Pelagicoccus sp. SDUM812005]|uniref:hypothetical protein n=1 Tax=Pelagicoccus sp. SDUM812005 TaxID=3041257 RepID=UPI00280ED06D|nr:hypothetical protein [Pelagicoccus sp. SDUM812005]MDQ8180165.1 hypothetical protein [Pelagicoccus sp. SDUM812005]